MPCKQVWEEEVWNSDYVVDFAGFALTLAVENVRHTRQGANDFFASVLVSLQDKVSSFDFVISSAEEDCWRTFRQRR